MTGASPKNGGNDAFEQIVWGTFNLIVSLGFLESLKWLHMPDMQGPLVMKPKLTRNKPPGGSNVGDTACAKALGWFRTYSKCAEILHS